MSPNGKRKSEKASTATNTLDVPVAPQPTSSLGYSFNEVRVTDSRFRGTTVIAKDANSQQELQSADNEFSLVAGRITDKTTEEYLKRRREYFGSYEAYLLFAKIADAELDANPGIQRKLTLDGDARKILYRWVKKAYENSGITDVTAVVSQQMSAEVKLALECIRKDSGIKFNVGGFAPRAKKDGHYKLRLGTLSEHALGNAVDIDASKNPTINAQKVSLDGLTDWQFIEQIAGMSGTRQEAEWKDLWRDSPEDLWRKISQLSTNFSNVVAQRVEGLRTVPGSVEKRRRERDPLDAIFEHHKSIKRWSKGFFTLEWKLVEQFYLKGFVWGATFNSSVDLHHFELPKHAAKAESRSKENEGMIHSQGWFWA